MGPFRSKAQRGASPSSQQLRVGIFTLLALVAAFLVIIVISDLGIRARGYPIAIHFKDVGGLQEGASVQVSGVPVGTVTAIHLLPDQTVLAEARINKGTPVYRQSKFLVSSTLTGQSTLVIRPPADLAKATVLEQGIPPDPNDAPWGTVPATIADLVDESQVRLKSLDKTIAAVNEDLPKLTRKFNVIASHTDALITHADTNFTAVSSQLAVTAAELDTVIRASGHNIVELSGNLNSLMNTNKDRVQQLVNALADTAKNLNSTMANFAALTGDPTIKASLVQTAVNFKDASEKLKLAATDLQSLTSDKDLQNQLRGTITNLNLVTARANDILGNFSTATTNTNGSNAAQPAGVTSSAPPGPGPTAAPKPGHRGDTRGLTFAEAQVRLTWSSKGGGGPSSDLNLTVLPRSPTSLTFGANDLGYSTTYNVLINRRLAPGFHFGGGVLYSKLGVKATYQPGPLGVDVRLYDPKHPTLDLYGDVRLARQLEIFYGERNLFGPNTKTPSFGLQANF